MSNLWVLCKWSDETCSWHADIPALDYFAHGKTLVDLLDACRETATELLATTSLQPLSAEWEQAIGRVLLRGDPIVLPGRIDAIMTETDTLVAGFQVLGKRVLWPHTVVIHPLIEDIFG